ncbi:MAG TPA: DUF3891 family protein [Pirellulales bacterium]|nr:DUF3891 family protein [Pirellulales bacterium]
MIRRAIRDETGAECWLLISQVEHARVSGLLAERWDPAPFDRLNCREELLAAIRRHDDGWADWERTAGVDPESGRPLSFTEMPLAESLAIWRASIASAGRHGDLAGHVVSAHFCSLLQRFSSNWRNDPAKAAIAGEFLACQQGYQAECLKTWSRRANVSDAPAIAGAALKVLQVFDALSLWLCCSEHPLPETFELPGGSATTIRSVAPSEAEISPWPFAMPRLEIEVAGRSVPAIRYRSRADLAVSPATQAKLKWVLLGGLGKKA